MKLARENGRYIFYCEINERFPVKDAGFQWNAKVMPNVWSTDSARKALKLAAYADDELRASIFEAAQIEPDPDRISLTFDGTTYRLWRPWAYRELGSNAGMGYAKHPRPHNWTCDVEAAIRCFNNAAQYEGLFECAPELRAQLENHLDERNQALEASRALDAEIDVPCPGDCEYLGFQKAGIRFMLGRPNTLVGDPTGVGKTIETLGYLNAIGARRVLIICPNSLKTHWRKHCEGDPYARPRPLPRWLVDKTLTVGVADSQTWPRTDIVIVHYEGLGRASIGGKKVLRHEIRDVEWDVLIIDESHWIKSPKAARTRFVTSIKAKHILALSGTPIPNRPKEIWSVLHMLDPATFKEFWPFAKRYCGMPKTRGPFGWEIDGASNLSELQAKMRSTVLLRREKSEVLPDLPPKRRQVIEMPVPKNLRSLLDAETTAEQAAEIMREQLRTRVELAKASDSQDEYDEAVEALQRGERATFTEMSALRLKTALASLPLAVEHITDLLENIPKILIGAHHVEIIKQVCEIYSDSAQAIYGDIKADERQGIVDWFNNDPDAKLLVCQFDTGGVGFSVRAAHAVAIEHCWVPGTLSQWEDRCYGLHRGVDGQPLLIQHLTLEGSLTTQMIRTCIAKQEIADRALDRKGGIDIVLDDVDTELPEEILVLPEKLASTDESMLQTRPATYDVKREQIAKEAEKLSPEQIALIHSQLKTLALRCDGAASKDGEGYNRYDAPIGRKLAGLPVLSPKQAILGSKILKKYERQLSLV